MRAHGDLTKPLPGEHALDKHQRKRDRKKHEDTEMRAALVRDRMTCRITRCEFPMLRVEPAHLRDEHRGMGGNPSGERTERYKIIALCARHHRLYDGFTLDIEQLEPDKGFAGLCAYYLDGKHIGTEKIIGVSVTRSAR